MRSSGPDSAWSIASSQGLQGWIAQLNRAFASKNNAVKRIIIPCGNFHVILRGVWGGAANNNRQGRAKRPHVSWIGLLAVPFEDDDGRTFATGER